MRPLRILRLRLQAAVAQLTERQRLRIAEDSASASPLTAAAPITTRAFAPDNFPLRNAAAHAGRARTFFDVSRMTRAAESDVPDNRASCSAAERQPSRFHDPPSSTRRANNAFAEVTNCSTLSNSTHTSSPQRAEPRQDRDRQRSRPGTVRCPEPRPAIPPASCVEQYRGGETLKPRKMPINKEEFRNLRKVPKRITTHRQAPRSPLSERL